MAATQEACDLDYLQVPDAVVSVELSPSVCGLAAQAIIVASYEGELSQGQQAWIDDRFKVALDEINSAGLHPSKEFLEARQGAVTAQEAWQEEIARKQHQALMIGHHVGSIPEHLRGYITG